MRFQQQTVVITGAGYGIGRAIALAFGAEGAHVVLGGRSRDKLETVAAQIRDRGGQALVQTTDVTSEAEVARLITAAGEISGVLDVLVNNSGIGGPTALARDVSDADWRQTIDVNLSGAFYAAKHASALMIERRRGVIINIASVAGRIGFPFRTPYAASKWGMIGLSHSLAAELGPYGVRVNAVLPGNIEGERFTNVLTKRAQAMETTFDAVKEKATKDTPLGRLITEAEVADTVLFLASPQAAAITGQALNVDGGLRMQ
jgi:NAD(P)-dependent dehydrogenase (short-subunit alcohol dehydrogenase family)